MDKIISELKDTIKILTIQITHLKDEATLNRETIWKQQAEIIILNEEIKINQTRAIINNNTMEIAAEVVDGWESGSGETMRERVAAAIEAAEARARNKINY